MGIVKYLCHRGSIDHLSARFSAFGKLRNSARQEGWHRWIIKETNEFSLEKMVIFIGKTGYGKSTTVNALAGLNILKTSDVEACTRTCQCLDFQVQGEYWFSLGDLPGIGESKIRDDEYLKLYADFLGYSSAIVHVLRADTRDYSIDEEATRNLFHDSPLRHRVIYALGQCDKIEPLNRYAGSSPTELQMRNIDRKIMEVRSAFSPSNSVIPYSAATGWNMHRLADEIVRVALRPD